MAMQSLMQQHITPTHGLPDTEDDPSATELATLVIEARARLAGASDKAWQVALEIVNVEQVSLRAYHMLTSLVKHYLQLFAVILSVMCHT
jgi:hypothetical protein